MATRHDRPSTTPVTTAADEGGALDPREALTMLEDERARTQRHLEPDARLLYGVWGVAWLVGFLAVWSSSTGVGPLSGPVAFGVFWACILAAVVVTAVHGTRRTAGVRGGSATTGSMYVWSWVVGFGAVVAITSAVGAAGASTEVLNVLSPALAALVVGLLYLAAGALWQEKVPYGLGVWIIVTGAVAALTGWPTNELVMALLGGGGFLVGAVVVSLAGRRSA